MKRVLLVALPVLLAVPSSALGEEFPKAEIFGGYSFFRAMDYLPTYGFSYDGVGEMNLHGWEGSIAGNITEWFGIEGDISGHYGSPSFRSISIPLVDVRLHSFMAGPKLAYRGNESVVPYAHFLIGAARAGIGAFGFGLGDNGLAAAIGGGVDIRLSDRVAVRAVQADYLMTRFEGYRQNNVRLSAGIVVRF